MNKKQLSDHIGNIDDRLVQQAEQIPDYAALHRHKKIRQLLAAAAVIALMVSSFSVGAFAFAREIIVEVPVEQETVDLEEIGLTLILPDRWKGQYEVVEDTFTPYDSPMWEFCVKSIYDAQIPADESGEVLYRGTLFYIFQYTDDSMSAEEFEQSGIAGIGRYLFATENATYVIMYATDVQYDPTDQEQAGVYQEMMSEIRDIQFVANNIALGYASDRLWLHKHVMERLKSDLNVTKTFHNGLDVGCGAGLSTKALRLICDNVTGTDISGEMIQVCSDTYDASEFTFYVAKAEKPILSETPYDIVTAAGVINWVDQEKFLKNMSLVMAKNAVLVIYDFWISDKMLDNDAYTEWFHNLYLKNFPKPPRKENVWCQSDMPEDFTIRKQVTYQIPYEFSLDSFIRFMMTQSNVNEQIQHHQKTESEIDDFMEQTLSPIFHGTSQTLIFDAYSWYIDRI